MKIDPLLLKIKEQIKKDVNNPKLNFEIDDYDSFTGSIDDLKIGFYVKIGSISKSIKLIVQSPRIDFVRTLVSSITLSTGIEPVVTYRETDLKDKSQSFTSIWDSSLTKEDMMSRLSYNNQTSNGKKKTEIIDLKKHAITSNNEEYVPYDQRVHGEYPGSLSAAVPYIDELDEIGLWRLFQYASTTRDEMFAKYTANEILNHAIKEDVGIDTEKSKRTYEDSLSGIQYAMYNVSRRLGIETTPLEKGKEYIPSKELYEFISYYSGYFNSLSNSDKESLQMLFILGCDLSEFSPSETWCKNKGYQPIMKIKQTKEETK